MIGATSGIGRALVLVFSTEPEETSGQEILEACRMRQHELMERSGFRSTGACLTIDPEHPVTVIVIHCRCRIEILWNGDGEAFLCRSNQSTPEDQ